jgi:hypothetical protein
MKMSDVGWTETKFQFHLFSGENATGKNARPFFGKYRVTPQARRLSGVCRFWRPFGEAGYQYCTMVTRMGTRHELSSPTAEPERN